jgi:cobalt/nickel transport system permease protein
MADTLVSAAVGGGFWLLSGGALARSSRRVQQEVGEDRVPLMGVLGAFVFCAQMVNFAIPGTGSSGHLGGGIFLAALLGPHAAVLVMGSVLLVQALFFADGGLLAFGCNLFNLGIVPGLVAYPLVFRPLNRRGHRMTAAVLGSVVALQLGALGVVLETSLSGLAGLPIKAFMSSMLLIHLPIALVEGLVTAGLLAFVARARPDALVDRVSSASQRILGSFLALALLTGGVLSWVSSSRPDGLEWSLARTAAPAGARLNPLHQWASRFQQRTAVLPDYAFRQAGAEANPARRAETSLSAFLGGVGTILLVAGTGWVLGKLRNKSARAPG